MDEFRKQLDALMGTNRNGDKPPNIQKHYTSPDVCKYYLGGLCPHDLFVNTKMDLGECPKFHSLPLKQDYEESRKIKDYGYEQELEKCLEHYVAECDRKIIKARKRLEENEQNSEDTTTQEINQLYAKAEELGEEGKVDESIELLNKAEQLKQKKASEQATQLLISIPSVDGNNLSGLPGTAQTTQQQKLRVCDICSAYLSIYDSDRRLADHFGGKLHIGYLQIREKLQQLKETKKGRSAEQDKERRDIDTEKNRESGEISADRDKEWSKDRQRDKDKTSSDRYRESRQRDEERDRDRYKHKGERRDRASSRDKDRHRH